MPRSSIPRLALARTDRYAIFLDCARDRYFALSPTENAGVLDLLDGKAIAPECGRAIAAAIDCPADARSLNSLLPTPLVAATRRASDIEHALPSDRLAALWHMLTIGLVLRARGLRAALDRVAREPPARAIDAATLPRIVAAHAWLSRHTSAYDDCLLRSLALARHARGHAADLRLVIAVKVDPFAAHCWVQVGEVALNEEPDAAAIFQPILVVP